MNTERTELQKLIRLRDIAIADAHRAANLGFQGQFSLFSQLLDSLTRAIEVEYQREKPRLFVPDPTARYTGKDTAESVNAESTVEELESAHIAQKGFAFYNESGDIDFKVWGESTLNSPAHEEWQKQRNREAKRTFEEAKHAHLTKTLEQHLEGKPTNESTADRLEKARDTVEELEITLIAEMGKAAFTREQAQLKILYDAQVKDDEANPDRFEAAKRATENTETG